MSTLDDAKTALDGLKEVVTRLVAITDELAAAAKNPPEDTTKIDALVAEVADIKATVDATVLKDDPHAVPPLPNP